MACISSPVLGEGPAAQTLPRAKNKKQEGMTDRPAPRPSAASLTGPRRSPWLGQRERGLLAPSGVPESSGGVAPVAGQGAEGLPPDPPRRPPFTLLTVPRPLWGYLLFIFTQDRNSGILGCPEFAKSSRMSLNSRSYRLHLPSAGITCGLWAWGGGWGGEPKP